MAARSRSSSLQRDAAALYDAATAFIRMYQFRDRDQALRFRLTVVQAYALDILLSRDGQRLTGLAEALQLDKSTTSRMVAGMKRHGLVEWSRPRHDRRAMWIVASAEGKQRYERLRRALVRENARLLASYAPAARRAAITLLRQLVDRAEDARRI
jgi:MarR family transcriptional regulator, 2-MHQ and catechol-resistance regulon repressor